MMIAQPLFKILGSKTKLKKMFARMKEFMHPDDISYTLIQHQVCEKLNENRLSHKTNNQTTRQIA